jgi:hypothetical protein
VSDFVPQNSQSRGPVPDDGQTPIMGVKLFYIWAGHKTRVHIMAGEVPRHLKSHRVYYSAEAGTGYPALN